MIRRFVPRRIVVRRFVPRRMSVRRIAVCVIAVALGFVLNLDVLWAESPAKERGLVYRLEVYNGRAHEYAYAPERARTIYALAGAPFVLNPRTSLVYYWPTTQRDLADWDTLDEPVTGTLEILQGGRVVSTFERMPYVLTRQGQSSEASLSVGPDAEQAYAAYQQALGNYWAALADYEQRRVEYDQALTEYASQTGSASQRTTGKPLPEPQAPAPVAPPKSYATVPEMGFVITLPAGQYQLRVHDASGRPLAGSDKDLIVFGHRRSSVSYTIIPESRWTSGERSAAPEDTVYAQANTTLYLSAFLAREYPALEYKRLTDPQDLDTREGWTWVDVQPLNQATLRFRRDAGAVDEIANKPYYVRQTSGASLGYQIVDYSAADMPGQDPSFSAFKVPVVGGGRIEIAAAASLVPDAGARSLRVVTNSNSWMLYLPALAVLLGAIALLFRVRRFKS